MLMPVTAKEVVAHAYKVAHWKGIGLGITCSLMIILFGLANTKGTKFENVALLFVAIETSVGVMGYAISLYGTVGLSGVFVLQLIVQSVMRGAAPLSSHIAVAWLRYQYGEKIDAKVEKWVSGIMADFDLT